MLFKLTNMAYNKGEETPSQIASGFVVLADITSVYLLLNISPRTKIATDATQPLMQPFCECLCFSGGENEQ